MPIYEYRCLKCNNLFEKLVLKSNQTISCPECLSGDVERQMSRFGFKVGNNARQIGENTSSGSSCASCVTHNCSHCH